MRSADDVARMLNETSVDSAPDTTGHHMAAALGAACKATSLRFTSSDSLVFTATRDEHVAWWVGSAAGHAFRAAELAYDAGARMQR